MLWILLVLAALVAGVLIAASMKPNEYTVERSASINAPPDRIFPLINDFQQWGRWSPYEKLDPALQRTFGGAPSGTGATYAWAGNSKAGVGRMEITQSVPSSQITIKLDFSKPFVAHNTTVFSLAPGGGSTRVSWVMKGSSPLMMKVMGLFMSMDNMIGRDFETGLSNLKAATEQ